MSGTPMERTRQRRPKEEARPCIREARRTFRKYFLCALTGAMVLSATNINHAETNNDMPGPQAAQPEEGETPPTTDAATIRESARQAVAALRDFILTGNAARRDEFRRIWRSDESEAFTAAFREEFRSRIYESSEGRLSHIAHAYNREHDGIEPNEFADAVQACYEELRRPESERNRGRLALLGRSFVEEMSGIITRTAVPVRVPGRLDDQTLDHILDVFSVSHREGQSRADRMRALATEVGRRFSIRDARERASMTRAILDAYLRTSTARRRDFGRWVTHLDSGQAAALRTSVRELASRRGARLPYEAVVTAFDRRGSSRRQLSQEEQLDRRFSAAIREGSLRDMVRRFEESPSGTQLERIAGRLEYITERSRILEQRGTDDSRRQAQELGQEATQLLGWLRDIGIRADTSSAGLQRLTAGLFALQTHYSSMISGGDQLLRYLSGIQSNRRLFRVYQRFLVGLDQRSLNIFSGIPETAPDYLRRIRTRMRERVSESRVRRARQQWFSDYYQPYVPARSGARPSITDRSLAAMATLEPLAAIAFQGYLEAVEEGSLGSERERTLVLQTSSQLHAVSPLLLVNYFSAIANLARICDDNPEIYLQTLTMLSARIQATTDPVTSEVSPSQVLPVNVRSIINRLDSAFAHITGLRESELTERNRLDLMDDRLRLSPYPPHEITQRAPGYAPELLAAELDDSSRLPPYPFPHHILTPVGSSLYEAGGLFTTGPVSPTYGGTLTMPSFNMFQLRSSTGAVAQSLQNYLHPTHPTIGIGSLPGTRIATLSATRLSTEISRAFIPTERPEYSFRPLGGGGGGGVMGTRADGEDWDVGGAGLGSILTSTGGLTFGGAYQPGQERAFGGATAVGVPVGIPLLNVPRRGDLERVVDSALAGYEMDDTTRSLLVRSIASQWNPENPSQVLISVNHEETGEDEDAGSYMLARYFFIDRNGQIFELLGGTNDFVRALNFAAGYGNQTFGTPTTWAWNYEPTIQRGGGALAVDIGRASVLAHAQAVPFFIPEDEPQPLLIQWTPGAAWTARRGERTDAYQLTFPGQMLRLRTGEDEQLEDPYILQDVDFMLRRVQGERAWELRLGAGVGHAGPTDSMMGRGGAFFRFQDRVGRGGGGLFYEGGQTNMMALALLQTAEDSRAYLESLHRIGLTVYGSRETANRLVLGALAHMVEQLAETDESVRHDEFLYRFIGIMRFLRSESGARLDVRRITGLDQMMTAYQQLAQDVGNDPSRAAELMADFRENYIERVSEIFDQYSLAVRVTERASLQVTLLMREDEDGWLSQRMERIQGRYLFTWRTGFWRAFASVPVGTPATELMDEREALPEGTETTVEATEVGIVGTGIGQDLFNGFFLQRAAVDAGIVMARMSVTDSEGTETEDWSSSNLGWFVQGAARVFSNVAEDSRQYRELRTRYLAYRRAIEEGRFAGMPRSVRETIAEGLPEGFPARLREGISSGRRTELSVAQAADAVEALYDGWYYEELFRIQERFDGHMRAYLAGSGYFFSEGVSYDIGTFIEYVDRFRAYLIAARRPDSDYPGGYAGVDVTAGPVTIGATGAATEHGVGVGASLTLDVGPRDLPVELTLSGYGHSTVIPQYASPVYPLPELRGTPNFGVMFYLTIGREGSTARRAPSLIGGGLTDRSR